MLTCLDQSSTHCKTLAHLVCHFYVLGACEVWDTQQNLCHNKQDQKGNKSTRDLVFCWCIRIYLTMAVNLSEIKHEKFIFTLADLQILLPSLFMAISHMKSCIYLKYIYDIPFYFHCWNIPVIIPKWQHVQK